jgi:hypothetical protein
MKANGRSEMSYPRFKVAQKQREGYRYGIPKGTKSKEMRAG